MRRGFEIVVQMKEVESLAIDATKCLVTALLRFLLLSCTAHNCNVVFDVSVLEAGANENVLVR